MDIQERILEIVLDLQSDVSELKTDVSELKTDVSELKTDVSGLKTGMSNLQSEHDRMLSLLLDTRTDVQTLNGRMDHMEDTSEKMYQMMDTFLLESRHHRAEITANRSRCDHLDQRVTRLEESRT